MAHWQSTDQKPRPFTRRPSKSVLVYSPSSHLHAMRDETLPTRGIVRGNTIRTGAQVCSISYFH